MCASSVELFNRASIKWRTPCAYLFKFDLMESIDAPSSFFVRNVTLPSPPPVCPPRFPPPPPPPVIPSPRLRTTEGFRVYSRSIFLKISPCYMRIDHILETILHYELIRGLEWVLVSKVPSKDLGTFSFPPPPHYFFIMCLLICLFSLSCVRFS